MPSNTDPKTIVLSSCEGILREAVAAVAIRPGMLIKLNANNQAIPDNVAGQEGQPAVAIENDLTGRGIDDVYAIGERVRYRILPDGAKFWGLVAAAQAIAIGDVFSSNGDGTLKEAAVTDQVVGYARSLVSVVNGQNRCIVEVGYARGIA